MTDNNKSIATFLKEKLEVYDTAISELEEKLKKYKEERDNVAKKLEAEENKVKAKESEEAEILAILKQAQEKTKNIDAKIEVIKKKY